MNVLLFGVSAHNISLIRSFHKSAFIEKIYITGETSIDCKNYKNVEFITINSVEGYKAFLENKNINLEIESSKNSLIIADYDKLVAVIINLVKNASEAFLVEESENTLENDKYIKIKTEINENTAIIFISNNAPGISEPEKIFNEGFSTKSTGSGLGLWICKKSIEEQMGELELSRYSEDYTEFSIKLGVGG